MKTMRIFFVCMAIIAGMAYGDSDTVVIYFRFSQQPGGLTNSWSGFAKNPNCSQNWLHFVQLGGEDEDDELTFLIVASPTNLFSGSRPTANVTATMALSLPSEEEGGDGNGDDGSASTDEHDYRFVCQWDDTADNKVVYNEPAGTYCKTLHLNAAPFNAKLLNGAVADNCVLEDVDVFYLNAGGKAGYCFEIGCSQPLACQLSFDNENWTSAEAVQLFNDKGKPINKYRFYSTDNLAGKSRLYVKICASSLLNSELNYTICAKKVRPLILVHGVDGYPTTPKNFYNEADDKITFSNIFFNISACEDFFPTIPFLFAWDSRNGDYTQYCNQGNNGSIVLAYFVKSQCQYWNLEPVVLAYSMGGILTLRQMVVNPEFSNQTKGFVC